MLKDSVKNCVNDYLKRNFSDVVEFWEEGKIKGLSDVSLQDHADFIYIKTLLGERDWINDLAVEQYTTLLNSAALSGRVGFQEHLLPHLSAYLLASLNLLASAGVDIRDKVLEGVVLDVNMLIDENTHLPKWPAKWSHHTWRVSHWIGGIPSILLSFARHDPKKQVDVALVHKVLEACDKHIVQDATGLMKAYRSEFLQQCFRLLYRLRHNPEHGDIGGLVHIHWVNYVLDRPYKAADSLIDTCMRHMQVKPFFEDVPYCLDFDYVQLLRTALEQKPEKVNSAIVSRVKEFRDDLVTFLTSLPESGYSLHKLPGALATLQETHLILNRYDVQAIDEPIDIIKLAYWL